MIKYWRMLPGLPKLSWGKLSVDADVTAELRKPHPNAVAGHCKPWIDAQSIGLIISWPHADAVSIKQDPKTGKIIAEGPGKRWVRDFAMGHWSFAAGYTFRTDPGVGLYTCPLPDRYRSRLEVKRGVVETEWYPLAMFFVFSIPFPGLTIELKYGDPMCMLVPVLLDKGLEEMSLDEENKIKAQKERYEAERLGRRDLLWTSAQGQGFSRLYKEKSRKNKQKS